MKNSRHFKQIILFLLTILLPSLGLIFLTVRMVRQEKELAERRGSEARHLVARQIGDELLIRLENIRQLAVGAFRDGNVLNEETPSIVVFLSSIEAGQLVLPWDRDQNSGNSTGLFKNPDLLLRLRQGERAEFVKKNYSQARQIYLELLVRSKTALQKNTIHLFIARTLVKSSQKERALSYYMEVLKLPFGVMDEYGIPLSLYSASQLLEFGKAEQDVLNRFYNELPMMERLSLSAVLLMQEGLNMLSVNPADTTSQARADSCRNVVREQVRKKEQIIALKNDFPDLGLNRNQNSPSDVKNQLWVLYGKDPWLINLFKTPSIRNTLVIAVSADKLFNSLQSDETYRRSLPVDFRFVEESKHDGLFLGPNFERVKIVYGKKQEQLFLNVWKMHPAFYILALLLILGITLFGAYLLLRDVRREVQIAEMRSQFVSSVSHELKTPLTSIRMFAETLRMKRLKDSKMKKEFLDTIVNESQRLTRLLNNMLDFSRIEKGKRMYRFKPASLHTIVQSARKIMAYPLTQQGFSLHVQTEKNLPDVQVDPDAIEQAILNLLHNAMKYAGESRDIQLILKREGNHILIQIIDQGIGISPKDQKQIFEKYYRVPSPENERIAGTGLGLALVSHIVEAHGGILTVESKPGEGSIFTIVLNLEGST